jgi:hypothetical protein
MLKSQAVDKTPSIFESQEQVYSPKILLTSEEKLTSCVKTKVELSSGEVI